MLESLVRSFTYLSIKLTAFKLESMMKRRCSNLFDGVNTELLLLTINPKFASTELVSKIFCCMANMFLPTNQISSM